MSFKSKIAKRIVMHIEVMHIKLQILFFASLLEIVDSHIGQNCSLEQITLPPSGYNYQLQACPSTVNFEARNLCLVPDIGRCSQECPGLCTATQSTMEYCIISWTCKWRLVPDNLVPDNPTTNTTTPPPPTDTGLTTSTWIGIIATITIVTFAVIFVLIWYFVFKPRYGPLRDEENFNVTYQHRECEEISFNMSRSLTSLAQCLSSAPTF
jgi:cbb3-type cytochrome oxidase subunit 3